MFLLETEAKIIENTLKWISWQIDSFRRGMVKLSTTVGMKQGALYSLALMQGFSMGPDVKTVDDLINHIFRNGWKEKPTDDKTSLATSFFELELINAYVALYDGNIKELREVQKILFSTRDKKLEESIKYIDQMYDENDNSFEKRLAAIPAFKNQHVTKIEAKKTDHSIEISHKNAIDSAFRILTLKLHPDKGGDAEHFKMLQEMRDHLLYVDVDDRELVTISNRTVSISILRVNVEQDFQAVRKLLQGKPIPKSWAWNEKSIKKMADDGVDTIALFEEGGIIGAIDVARRGSKTPKPSKQKTTEEKETLEFCIQCGAELKPEAKFCGSCGTSIA